MNADQLGFRLQPVPLVRRGTAVPGIPGPCNVHLECNKALPVESSQSAAGRRLDIPGRTMTWRLAPVIAAWMSAWLAMAARADHTVAARDMRLHERQADAAVGSGYEYGLHMEPRCSIGFQHNRLMRMARR